MCKSLETLKKNIVAGKTSLSKVTIKNIINENCFERVELGYSYDGREVHKGNIIEDPINWFNHEYNTLSFLKVSGLIVKDNIAKITIHITSNEWYYLFIDLSKDYSKLEDNININTFSVETLKTVDNIINVTIEMKWDLISLKINNENCIEGYVIKSTGKKEWEGLYAPSHEKTELQEVFDCLKSRIINYINVENIEEIIESETPIQDNVTIEIEGISQNKPSINPYTHEKIEEGYLYTCHFAKWNMNIEEIQEYFKTCGISFIDIGNKIGFENVNYNIMIIIEQLNNKNGSILFIESKKPIVNNESIITIPEISENTITPEPITVYNSDPKIADESIIIENSIIQNPTSNILDQLTIKSDINTKTNADIFVVKLKNKVEYPIYKAFETEIKSIGGYRSRFKKGFVFTDENTKESLVEKLLTIDVGILTSNSSDIDNSTEYAYTEIDINDIESYTISKELSKRENDGHWILRTKERNHQEELQSYLQSCNDEVMQILESTISKEIEYKLKSYLQYFKKMYYKNYMARLTNQANNASWITTGRSGRNISKDQKSNNRYDNLMRELIQLESEYKDKISTFKNKIDREHQQKLKDEINTVTSAITDTSQFKRVKVKYNGDATAYNNIFNIDNTNFIAEGTAHQLEGYSIIKNWGCFRVYNKDGKEVYNTKTNEGLEVAKKYVLYLLQLELKQDSAETKQQQAI